MACSCNGILQTTKKEWSTAIGKKWEQRRCNSVRSKMQRTHTGCSHLSKGQWQTHVWLLTLSWWLTGEAVWVGWGHREIAWMLATFYMSTLGGDSMGICICETSSRCILKICGVCFMWDELWLVQAIHKDKLQIITLVLILLCAAFFPSMKIPRIIQQ